MFKKLFVLLGLVGLLIPVSVSGAGIDVLKGLIPNRVGVNYLVTTDDYSIPALAIDSCHIQKVSINENATLNYNFILPKILLDAEGELGIGSCVGIGQYNYEFQLGFYSIIGKNQHESNKDYRAFISLELF